MGDEGESDKNELYENDLNAEHLGASCFFVI